MADILGGTVVLATGKPVDIDLYGDLPIYSKFLNFWNTQQQELRCFNFIVGQTIPGTAGTVATKWDTNLDKTQQGLGYSEEMLVHAIGIKFPKMVGTAKATPPVYPVNANGLLRDLVDILEKTYFRFECNNTIYSEGHLDDYPIGSGIYYSSDLNQSEYCANGFPSSNARRPFGLPIHISGKTTFAGIAQFKAALALNNAPASVTATAYEFHVYLFGIRSRYQGTTNT